MKTIAETRPQTTSPDVQHRPSGLYVPQTALLRRHFGGLAVWLQPQSTQRKLDSGAIALTAVEIHNLAADLIDNERSPYGDLSRVRYAGNIVVQAATKGEGVIDSRGVSSTRTVRFMGNVLILKENEVMSAQMEQGIYSLSVTAQPPLDSLADALARTPQINGEPYDAVIMYSSHSPRFEGRVFYSSSLRENQPVLPPETVFQPEYVLVA